MQNDPHARSVLVPAPFDVRKAWVAAAFATFVAGSVALGIVLHLQGRESALDAARDALGTTARLSAIAVDTWTAERLADAQSIGSNALLTRAVERWLREPGARQEEGDVIQEVLESIRHSYGYTTVALIDPDRLQTSFLSGQALNAHQVEYLARRDAYVRPEWVELPAAGEDNLRIGLVHGLASRDRQVPWSLYLEIKPEWLLSSLRLAQPTHRAGETVLLHRDQRGARLMTATAGARLLSFASTYASRGSETAQVVESQMASGVPQQLHGINRDGARVLAQSQNVRLPSWILVTLLREDAVFADLHARTRLFIGALGALLVLGILALLAWRRGDRHKAAAREARLRRRYEQMMLRSDAMFMLSDHNGRILDASDSALKAYGYSRTQLIGMSIEAIRAPGARGTSDPLVGKMVPGDVRSFQEERIKADGSRFVLEGTIGMFESDGKHYFVNVGRDVTSQKALESQLGLAANFFERSAAGIIISDANKQIVKVNSAVTAITGYAPEELQGKHTSFLNAGLEPEVLTRARDSITSEDYWEGELRGRRKDGSVFPARLLVSAYRDKNNVVFEYVDIFTDLTRLKRAERQAEYLAFHDQLTELPNRAMLEKELHELIESLLRHTERPNRSITVALLNLDRFKYINESFGHTCGDKLLLEVSRRLRTLSPNPRTLYRYGGDEFMLVMTGDPVTHALTVSQVRAVLAPPVLLDDHPVSPTASIGIAAFPDHALDADGLVRNVESAMRIAKSHGRNTWRMYEPEMNASAFDDMLLAVDLRQSMNSRELELHLQPQFSLQEERVVGFEALLRWTHPTRGAVNPARFIPIAESSGLIQEISSWVLREAARIWSGWRAQGLVPLPIAINLSAVQFQSHDFVDEVASTMREYDLIAGALEMELTESLIMADTDAAVERMFKLVDMGVQLAIDDFGTGYSSLSYLRRFPVKKLKIDRSFVLGLGDAGDKEGEAIASAVIAMAKSLQLKVIAEGVETKDQRDFLKKHGCDEVQGYLYGRPTPLVAASEMLERAKVS